MNMPLHGSRKTGTGRKKPRCEHRQRRLLVCQMDSNTLDSQRVVMLDISPSGMACRAIAPPETGDDVWFQLGNLEEAQAKVMWVVGSRFGVRFTSEIDAIAISFAKTGFRSMDYDLPRDEAFERMMLSELFRAGELS